MTFKMTSVISALILGTLALGSAGCSKSLPKLTDDQKAALGATAQATVRGPSAATNIGGGAMTGLNSFAAQVSGLIASAHSSSISSSRGLIHDDTEVSMEGKLRSAHDSHACDITANVPAMSGSSPSSMSMANMNMTLKVTGGTCPLAMDFEMTSQASQNNVSMHVSGSYNVTDKDFAALNDVNTISLDGTLTGTGTSQNSGKVSANVSGSLVSQKYGNISFTASTDMSVNGDNSQGEVVLDVVFPNFEAKIVAKANGNSVTYTLNGEDISEDQLMSYLSGTPSSAPGTPTPATPAVPAPPAMPLPGTPTPDPTFGSSPL